VAEEASLKQGGEATKPLLFFQLFRKRGVDVRLLVHVRRKAELLALLKPDEHHRLYFVDDAKIQQIAWRIIDRTRLKVAEQTLGTLSHFVTQRRQRRIARELVRQHGIEIVHEPIPISPKQTSMMYGLGAPVVIGPLCGGMTYPPGFSYMESRLSRTFEKLGRQLAQVLHWIWPGKVRAGGLVVANDRTKLALPRGARGKVYWMPESGVDVNVASPGDGTEKRDDGKVRFIFVGRIVDWKAVDLLVEAFKGVADAHPGALLEIVGDGPETPRVKELVTRLDLAGRVTFAGWLSRAQGAARLRASDVFTLTSLRECGGNALLEAMGVGLPSVVTNWGGPGAYVDDTCGLRVDPTTRDAFIAGLTAAMLRLAADPALRRQMGDAARVRLRTGFFEWESKADRMLEIYRDVIDASVPTERRSAIAAPAA
jgi:glycosyltransferase involved in cell wall biosynthesis